MPYNDEPILPSEKVTGSTALPLARVKRIIAQDDEIAQCSESAAFTISVATEIFVRYLTEQAYTVVKSERKPRKNVAYKDVAAAVARYDNLEFLADVVPKTKTYRQFKEEKAREQATNRSVPVSGMTNDSGSKSIDQMIQQQPRTNGHSSHGGSHSVMSAPQDLVTRTVPINGHTHPQSQADTDMAG